MEEPHHFFDFLTTGKYEDGLTEALGGLMPRAKITKPRISQRR